jgi:hypothetical protein
MQLKHAADRYTDWVTMSDEEATPGREAARPGRLSDMVLAAQRTGLSYAQMATRSVGPSGEKGMSKPWFQRLAVGGVLTAPKPEELEAVARGIGRPVRVIKEAAASQWLDWESYELSGYDDDMRHIIIHAAGMAPQERRRLRAMLDAADQVDRDAASG